LVGCATRFLSFAIWGIIRHILHRIAPPDIAADVPLPDPDLLFPFDMAALEDGRLAK